jgi:hypothetical protein
VTGWALALCLATSVGDLRAQERRPENRIDLDEAADSARVVYDGQAGEPGGTRFRDFTELTRGAKKIDGMYTLYQKGDHLYAEIRPDQFNQPWILPITIARGMGQVGMPAGDMFEEKVFVFKRVGDRIQLVRRNIHYKATAGTPIDKSVQQNYVDSIVLSLPILSQNMRNGNNPVIDFADIFLTNFAELPLGTMDRTRSGWHRVKGFPNNLELEVEATFSLGRGGYYGMLGEADGVADSRGITLVIHYSLMKAPEGGYHPRAADDRVGHFLSASKDFGKSDSDTNFVRLINRWRLEKADPKAELSPPTKQIVWYIEDTVPIEYRPFVESGIREWNKAFEKIGFVDAIAVRWQQPGRDDFDPEDTNYCTFRWVTSDASFAMSCLRANPMTGEMIDGDVIFDASFIRYWKQSYALLVGTSAGPAGEQPRATRLAMGEVISPILAAKMGYGNPALSGFSGLAGLKGEANRLVPEAIPSEVGGLQWMLGRNRLDSARAGCQFHSGISRDFSLAAIAFADADPDVPRTEKDPQSSPKNELPRDFVGQAIKHIVMHEVGHSLGLRHNFKASTMLAADQLNDTAITRVKGLVGSVMDYSPINIAPRGHKQGDFYSTTIGPYDYWAIEYAYKPFDGNEDEQLKKVAARAPESGLTYATDEDVWSNGDPQVNRFDLGSDPCRFAKDRIALAVELMKELDTKVVKDGDSWSRTRKAFGTLIGEWGNGAILASQYVGGQSVSREHKGDKGAREPIIPIAGAKQRECLAFLADQILSDKAYQFSPSLLRRLGTEKWMHWGSNSSYGMGVDISVLETILAIQKIVLSQCLSATTLNRLQNQQLQAEPGSEPLRMEEVFRTLTDASWSEACNLATPADEKTSLSALRRNLQREYLRRLTTMVLGNSSNPLGDRFSYIALRMGDDDAVPADARSLARLHLSEIGERIDKALDRKDVKLDDTTRAHLKESRQRITKALDAGLEVREP